MTQTAVADKEHVRKEAGARNPLLATWNSVIGKKVVMAVTGAVLVLFVIAHMVGNLKIFSGPDEINAYSRFLREVGYAGTGLRATAVDRPHRACLLAWFCTSPRRTQLTIMNRQGAPGRLRHQERRGDHLGRADHALGRRAAARFHRVSPVPLHGGHGRISARAV